MNQKTVSFNTTKKVKSKSMTTTTKSFGKQLKDYVSTNGDVVKDAHGVVACAIPLVISGLIALVGVGVIPGGKLAYYVSFYVMAFVLALAAALTLGDKRHTEGNEDVAPTVGLGAILLTLGLAALACFKDLGAFQTVLGG
ncbi:hypothetical protein [Arthrobacter sp. UYEF20]|uniref:hypothetical protein n=1 Tax=Arthrobacter sp. UYEF20 TaxID=1756363 RepID=UPI0033960830